jgi:hypothetical protein
VIERLESRHPTLADQYQQFQNQFGTISSIPGAQQALDAARAATGNYGSAVGQQPPTSPGDSFQNGFDTARRPAGNYPQ